MDIGKLIEERDYLDGVIRKALDYLATAPKGHLTCYRKGGHVYYNSTEWGYLSMGRDKALIEALARKDYERRSLKVATGQKEVIERFLENYRPNAFSEIVGKWDPQKVSLIIPHGDFRMSDDEIAAGIASKSETGSDLARYLIGICEAFLKAKGEK